MTDSSTSTGDDEGKGSPGPPRRGGARVLVVSMVLSAVIHAAAIFIYPLLVRRAQPTSPATSRSADPTRFRATEVIRLAEVPEEPEEAPPREPPEPEPEPEPRPPEEPAEAPREEEEAGEDEEVPEEPTAAERLRPGDADPRIWRPVSPQRTRLTDEERARLRIQGKLQAWNDSVAARGELGPNVDWTFTDDEGRRWGLSPGKLHLGGLTLPMPSFWGGGTGAGDLQETLQRQWEIEDIERAARQQEVLETLRERAKEIRERKDAERKAKADSTGGGGGDS